MTWPAVIGLLILGAVAGLMIYGLAYQWYDEHQWRKHEQRMAARDERLAAQNGRPHTEAILQHATPRRREEDS